MLSVWPTVLAAFLASLVEFVEALTIVLAVGSVRGWRPALIGAGAAAAVLAVLVVVFGPHLAHWNVPVFQLVVGTLLVLFGLRWLRKSILRAAGVIALHDEAAAFEKQTSALRLSPNSAGSHPAAGRPQSETGRAFDLAAASTSFNGVFVEGLEVVFIVLAVGAAGGPSRLIPAAIGAAAAAILVVALGLAAHKPLTRVPENALKMIVGVLLSAFGTFWVGEGLRLSWPGGDFSLLGLSLGYGVTAAIGVALARAARPAPQPEASQV